MIEFIEEQHIYLKDGMIIPSVSEILHFIFPNKYKNVPKNILNNKANYGTTVHSSIELYENNLIAMQEEESKDVTKIALELNIHQELSLEQYIKIKKENNIQVLEQERMISYNYDYCGRFDMIAMVDKNKCLCDIKTTSVLDKNYLSWQLSYYELATGEKFDKLYAIWLPKKGLGKLVEIERIEKKELIKKIGEFKKWKLQSGN